MANTPIQTNDLRKVAAGDSKSFPVAADVKVEASNYKLIENAKLVAVAGGGSSDPIAKAVAIAGAEVKPEAEVKLAAGKVS